MNLDSLPGLLLAWLKTQGATLLQSGQPPGQARQPPFQPGGTYQGKVLDALPNGRSLVKVADQVLDMALPRQIRVGDSVRLTYLNAAPRPTFLLEPSPAPAPVRLSGAAQQVSALIRFAGTPAPGTPATTAPGGSPPVPAVAAGAPAPLPGQRPLVVNVAQLQAPRATPGVTLSTPAAPGVTALPAAGLAAASVEAPRAAIASGTVLTPQLIWDQPAQASRVLPQRLRQVMRESGLFYESHQARWVKGEVSLEALRREPQARLAGLDGPRVRLPELAPLPEETARLAGRQLLMLEGQPFVWQGQAWPGQGLEWLVEERQAAAGDDPEAPAWRTMLRLTLPRLGEIEADLSLGAAGLTVRLSSAEPASLPAIRAALPDLLERLAAAELNPRSVSVEDGHG